MTGIVTTVTLGCDPEVLVTLIEDTDGSLYVGIAAADGSEIEDIDGFFFDLASDSSIDSIEVFPTVDTAQVTGFMTDAGGVDSLSNGATLADTYDAAVQFGTSDGSTEGALSEVAFTLYSSDGSPITVEDIDLDGLAVVIDSDGSEGMVLTTADANDVDQDDEGDGSDPEPNTCEFLIEGDVNVRVTLTELDDGNLEMVTEVLSGDDPDATGQIGDLRAIFFDVSDESVLSDVTATGADVTDSAFEADGVSNLGNGANVNGRGNDDGDFDGGVEIGTQGIGADDIQSTTVVLQHPDGLSIDDFSGEDFAIRLTSVGSEGDEDREGSLKLVGNCPEIPEEPEPEDCDDQYSLGDVMGLMNVPVEDIPDARNEEDLHEVFAEIDG